MSDTIESAIDTVEKSPIASQLIAALKDTDGSMSLVQRAAVAALNMIGEDLKSTVALYEAVSVFDKLCPQIAGKSIVGLPPIPKPYCWLAGGVNKIFRQRALDLGASETQLSSIDDSLSQLSAQFKSTFGRRNRFPTWLAVIIGALVIALVTGLVVLFVSKNKQLQKQNDPLGTSFDATKDTSAVKT